MISRTIWCYALLCVLVSSTANGKSPPQNQINFRAVENGIIENTSFAVTRTEPRTKNVKIIKRGIVLVDEDFDVPSAIYAHENNSGTGVDLRSELFDRNEGSGNDVSAEKDLYNVTQHAILTDTPSTTESTSTVPTKEVTLKVTKDITPLKDLDGSGDNTLVNTKEYSVTEAESTPDTELKHNFYDTIPDICMNSTCSQDDLSLSLTKNSILIAAGTNLSLSCKSNNSNHNMLYWYKSNGTIYFLQAVGTEEELQFNIPVTKPVHSGMYTCVKWVNTQTCCNLKSYVSVYKMPMYKFHLIILGLIAAAGFIICISLSVRQTVTLRNYKKQFAEKHGSIKQRLL